MALLKYGAPLALLMSLIIAVAANESFSPTLSPNFGEICKEVNCGRGTCKANMDSKFGFKCECEANWRRTRFDEDQEDDLEFLPCVIPNCTLDYSCMPAAPPTPPIPNNFSVFDPCYWAYCGEGTCVKNLTYGQTCQCNRGYTNLLNVSAFPCYSDCALGADCGRLGINVSRSSSTPNNDDSQGASFLPSFISVTVLLMATALAIGN